MNAHQTLEATLVKLAALVAVIAVALAVMIGLAGHSTQVAGDSPWDLVVTSSH